MRAGRYPPSFYFCRCRSSAESLSTRPATNRDSFLFFPFVVHLAARSKQLISHSEPMYKKSRISIWLILLACTTQCSNDKMKEKNTTHANPMLNDWQG